MEPLAIRTEKLTRVYKRKKKKNRDGTEAKDLHALAGVDLEVRPGELFGLLGPNGAGKTTLIKILTTLLAPTSGQAWVDGKDVVTQTRSIRPLINMVSGGETCGYGVLTVRENLWLFTQIYGITNAEAAKRIEFMLDVVGLRDKADTKVSHLSTGQRQKMNFCRGFITHPKILFLDEPTLGLDVNAARTIRKFVREWLSELPGRTLLLTTHYMAEAEELCDRLAIIDGGKILACETPANLKKAVQAQTRFDLTLNPGIPASFELEKVPGVQMVDWTERPDELLAKLTVENDGVIGPIVQQVIAKGNQIRNLQKVEPSLEEVFVKLVGRSYKEAGSDNGTET